MRLVTYTRINHRFFERGSAPSKAQWTNAILSGEINGKVAMEKVWIDMDDFLSRDFFSSDSVTEKKIMDLLHG